MLRNKNPILNFYAHSGAFDCVEPCGWDVKNATFAQNMFVLFFCGCLAAVEMTAARSKVGGQSNGGFAAVTSPSPDDYGCFNGAEIISFSK